MILNGVFSDVIIRISKKNWETTANQARSNANGDPLMAPDTPSVMLCSDTGIIGTIVDNSNSGYIIFMHNGLPSSIMHQQSMATTAILKSWQLRSCTNSGDSDDLTSYHRSTQASVGYNDYFMAIAACGGENKRKYNINQSC